MSEEISEKNVKIIGVLIVITIISMLIYSFAVSRPEMCEVNFGIDLELNEDVFLEQTGGLITGLGLDNIGIKAPCDSELFGSLKRTIEKVE